ncbi:hypothetical protein QBC38DRAFT_448762 [Podospora fimiseda]|uniref:Uncharacterized protein n=1 Tax=Podospora fimiseda TaxID=252190 RepID=A0AAN7BFC6_9PEZI|nr:hypothetical protein QBC38DRAFT_448762 [Podospora fimiseda]
MTHLDTEVSDVVDGPGTDDALEASIVNVDQTTSLDIIAAEDGVTPVTAVLDHTHGDDSSPVRARTLLLLVMTLGLQSLPFTIERKTQKPGSRSVTALPSDGVRMQKHGCRSQLQVWIRGYVSPDNNPEAYGLATVTANIDWSSGRRCCWALGKTPERSAINDAAAAPPSTAVKRPGGVRSSNGNCRHRWVSPANFIQMPT